VTKAAVQAEYRVNGSNQRATPVIGFGQRHRQQWPTISHRLTGMGQI
jgi:hypothetical protein